MLVLQSQEKKNIICLAFPLLELIYVFIWQIEEVSPGQLVVGGPAWAGFGPDDLQRSLPTFTILWFCDSVSYGGQWCKNKGNSFIIMISEKKKFLTIQDWISLLSFVTYNRIRQYIWIIFSLNQRRLFHLSSNGKLISLSEKLPSMEAS